MSIRWRPALALLMCGMPAICAGAATAAHPNILLIIGDDFGIDVTSDMYPGLIDDLTAKYGPAGLNHPDYRAIHGKPASTPVLNQLARQGMRFSSTWAQPFCSPTRSSILTGLFSAKTGVLTYADALSQHHTSFVRKLKDEAGYSTAVFGKWHMAGLPGKPVDYPGMKPKEAGFDIFKGNLHAAIATYWDYDYQIQDNQTAANEWRKGVLVERSLPGIAPTTYAPVVKAADTIEWITAQRAQHPDKPWFVWLAFNLSHATAKQQPSAMAVPNADTLNAEAYKEMKDCGGTFGSNNVGSCSGESLMRAMTNSVDTVIGKVLEAVGHIDPNTYVIYVSDNGTPMYARPNLDFIDNMYITKQGRGKGTAYESGTRVAMVIKGPGIKPDSSNGDYVHVADLFSTVLNIAGIQAPRSVPDSSGTGMVPLDSVSLGPILFGQAKQVRDPDKGYLLAETVNLMTNSTRQAGARNATHKVVCTDGTDNSDCEFFNLAKDPLEEYRLAKPNTCIDPGNRKLKPADERWQYCRLLEIIKTQSFMANGEQP
ncbi:MAG: sulfatase-like hydrolase/transferase [Pseudomonadota bacterium]